MAGVRKLRSGTWQGWYQHYEGRRAYFTLTRRPPGARSLPPPSPLRSNMRKFVRGIPRPNQHRVVLSRPIG